MSSRVSLLRISTKLHYEIEEAENQLNKRRVLSALGLGRKRTSRIKQRIADLKSSKGVAEFFSEYKARVIPAFPADTSITEPAQGGK